MQKFLDQINAEQAKLDTARAFLRIHGQHMGKDFPGVFLFGTHQEPVLLMLMPYHERSEENRQRMLVLAGEVFGRDGWTRHVCGSSRYFDWKRKINGVTVQIDEAESTLSPLEGSPVLPRLFPLQLAAPESAPAETSISDNGECEGPIPF